MAAHGQAPRDDLGLIDPAGAGAADIELLKTDNVRRVLGDHVRDAAGLEAAVDADATVHVIGQEARHGLG